MRIRVTLEVEYNITDVTNRDEQVMLWAKHCSSISEFRTPGLVQGSASCNLMSVVVVEE